jgi:hypothetical protein
MYLIGVMLMIQFMGFFWFLHQQDSLDSCYQSKPIAKDMSGFDYDLAANIYRRLAEEPGVAREN